jgi:ATP-binding cassette subfamily B protein
MRSRATSSTTPRALAILIATAFRVDPVRTLLTVALTPLLGAATALLGVGVGRLIDAAVAGNRAGAVAMAAFLAISLLAVYQLGMIAAEIRLVLQTNVAHAIDQRAITLVTGLDTIEHHENPAYLDRLELLRHRRLELSAVFGALVENARAIIELGAVVVVLATVQPVLVALPLTAVPAVLAGRYQERLVAAADAATADARRLEVALTKVACDPAAARELRVCGAEQELRQRHGSAVTETRRRRDLAHTRGTLALAAGWTVFAGGLAGAVLLLVAAALRGEASAGDVALALTIGTQLAAAVGGVLLLVRWLASGLRAIGDYVWLIDHAATRPRPAASLALPLTGDVVLDAVSFGYPGTSNTVLQSLSMRLPAGSTVALVGENGAGKSTLVKLLCGFYRPTSGTISYGGQPLTDVDPKLWRARLTACFQDFGRIELTCRESVGIGNLDDAESPRPAPDPQLRHALINAGAGPWLDALPAGLDTPLGAHEDGVQPSSGQWQQLALARAGLRSRPAVMILDEPSASLDPITEHRLVERYIATVRAADPGTIILLISHRFATVQHADVIAVLEQGRLVEMGSHQELVTRGQRYAQLHGLHAGLYPAKGA